MPNSIQKWRYLLEVADRGGFAAAAAALGVAQSALSRHVKELEQFYGYRLLHRTGRGVVPTTVAETFLPRIRALVREAERLSDDILAARGDVVGRIRLGIAQSLSGHVLTPLLREIAVRHPRLDIFVREGLSDHIDQALATGDADLGILYARHDEHRADDEFLMSTDFVLAGAAGEPCLAQPTCTLKDASRLSLIAAATPNRWRSWVEHVFATAGLRLTIASELDSLQAIKDLVQLPGHFSIISPHLVQREVEAGLVATSKIVDPFMRRRAVLRYPARKSMNLGCKAIADILHRQVREHVHAGRIPHALCEEDRS